MLMIRIIGTIAMVIFGFVLQKLFQHGIDRYVQKYGIAHKRSLAMHKTKTILIYGILIVGIVLLWGFTLENVLVSILGMLGLIAIGFVAVWSILSNVVAGILLFFNQALRIEDEIEILPEGIRGTVLDINSFFVILIDGDGARFNIPNNFFFQKVVKHISGPAMESTVKPEDAATQKQKNPRARGRRRRTSRSQE